jgi:hypothetical protein
MKVFFYIKTNIKMAPDKFKNFVNFLKSNDKLQIISTPESLFETKIFSFQCLDCNQISTFAQASFSNKMYNTEPKNFCAICIRNNRDLIKFNKIKTKVFTKTGHTILTCNFGGDRECTYKCGNCGNQSSGYYNNLLKNTGVCQACQNNKNKVDFDIIEKTITELGFKLDMKKEDYTDNKSLQIFCKCGNSFKISLHDLKRGRQCVECKMERCFDSGVKFRDYKFPSGRIVKIQGFEDKGLNYILSPEYINPITNTRVTEDDIIVGKQIGYFTYKMDMNDKVHRYYPDIHIKNTNLYIEIKSNQHLH